MVVLFKAAEQNNMDPTIARKKGKKHRAPAPPNPFTGEIEREALLRTSEGDDAEEVCYYSIYIAIENSV